MNNKYFSSLIILSLFSINITAEIKYKTEPVNYSLIVQDEDVYIEYNCAGYGQFKKDRKKVFEKNSISKSGKCSHIIDIYNKKQTNLQSIKEDVNSMSSIMENEQ